MTPSSPQYPKRLIEVDLPIKRISEHARPEKTTVHGNISTLHIWWARRPHAACRAVACAALWLDPADGLCPQVFRETAKNFMGKWATDYLNLCGEESFRRFVAIQKNPSTLSDNTILRQALLDFIADFSKWENQATPGFLETARAITACAHQATGGAADSRPLVFDPFAGGGTIPLECLRIGADAFASDLNPLAVLLNKAVLEFIPRNRDRVKERLDYWAERVKERAAHELSGLYPRDPDGAQPLVYLWARTICCEGPTCGLRVPLIRTLDLGGGQYLRLSVDKATRSFRVAIGEAPGGDPTVKGGSVSCPDPACGYTTPAKAVRTQLAARRGGSKDAQLLAVLVDRGGCRKFRSEHSQDFRALKKATDQNSSGLPLAEVNPIRPHKNTRGLSAVTRIGMTRFQDLYTDRQLRTLEAFSSALISSIDACGSEIIDRAALTLLGLCFGRLLHQNSTCSRWLNKRNTIAGSFGKQALQVTWDFTEIVPTVDAPGSWNGAVEWVRKIIDLNQDVAGQGTVGHAPAQQCPLPSDSASLLFTDPPYFAAIPYADLAGFFYVWERQFFLRLYPDLFDKPMIDQTLEIIVTDANAGPNGLPKDENFFREQMTLALARAREIVVPNGIGVVVFADTRTASWEALLGAVVASGWVITASWPIDTEHQNRTQAQGSASLQSSIHLVCRPRENPDGSLRMDEIGDWRDVLTELPKRIHDWLPRLADEGIVGADAIFACLGPALEIFSRYSRVEKASGDQVSLREYLEEVWAAVAREALHMIFTGADATGFEEDSRLTAMWLWTLNAGNHSTTEGTESAEDDTSGQQDEEDSSSKTSASSVVKGGFVLEYDAARKIAQGLGAHLEKLANVVEVKGDKARLLPVSERTRYLFGKDEAEAPKRKRKKKQAQKSLFAEVEEAEKEDGGWGEKSAPKAGETTLDRVHQAMILFAAGRSEAMKRFLVEEGIGQDQRFWRLAQALCQLYPANTDEKRWVDGVLARKKGLGL